VSVDAQRASGPPRVSLYNRPTIRAAFYQLVLLAAVLWFGYEFALNAKANLEAQKITSGFGFLENTAGFGVNQSLIPYNESDTYGRVFLVGLLNTLLVAGVGIVLATILGFLIGIARLSPNWLVARLAGGYVELIRNLPLLFQILFWYLAVLGTLPGPRQSISLFGEVFINNRGIIVPAPVVGEGAGLVFATFAVGVLAAIVLRLWAKRRRVRTGRELPVLWINLGLIIALPLAVLVATGVPIGFAKPELRGFNFIGGVQLIPEFVALLLALTTYTAAFIAEIVRAGILAVPRGQTEAALALGLRRGLTLRLIVVPQALRVIVPPLSNQYLNLTKNSSLAVAVGYPDLFAVFAGTTLHQTGQAIEIIAITMAVYLAISLLTSGVMNWYNAHVRIAER
jgi:general L-amino acid transport system permease protein